MLANLRLAGSYVLCYALWLVPAALGLLDLVALRQLVEWEYVTNPPSGCHLHPRCRYAVNQCRSVAPELRPLPTPSGGTQLVARHRAEELALQGVPD